MVRRSSRLTALGVLVAVAALAVTACNADVSQNDDVDPDVASVSPGIAALYAGDDADAAATAEAGCFADALLDRLKLDDLVAAGLVKDDGTVVEVAPMLDVDTAEAWVEAQETCVSFVEVSTRALAAQSKGRLDQEAYAACLTETITDGEIHAALVRTLTGGFDSPEVARLTEAQAGCARDAVPAD